MERFVLIVERDMASKQKIIEKDIDSKDYPIKEDKEEDNGKRKS